MIFRFANPWLLLLLIGLLPLVVWTGARLELLGPLRRTIIVTTRIVIVALLVLALARIQRIRETDILDVFFVLDGSDSIPQSQKEQQIAFLQNELKKMSPRDRSGVVVFGSEAVIESIPTDHLQIERLLSEPNRSGTNVGEAIRLAIAALTGENKKRIVLASDGNENIGSAISAAQSAAAHKIPVDAVPVNYDYRNDAIVESVSVNGRVNLNAPFDVKVFVRSAEPSPARLDIYCDNKLLSSQSVRLEPDRKNVFVLTSEVTKPGFHTYRVQVTNVAGDTNLANNEGVAFTYATGEPLVLFVDGNPPAQNVVVPALASEKIHVDYTTPDGLPEELGSLQNYDSIILSNVGANELGQRRMELIERAVHELGLGLVMIGGDKSFGAGGYQDSPVERTLPVSMDVSHKKVLPRGALVVILHTCEIPSGNYWAQQIALAALDVMSSRDLMGLLYWGAPVGGMVGPMGGFGEQWLFTLQEVGDKSRMTSLIRQCQPSDMPSMESTIKMAYGALSECNASVKHIVIITDGDPAPPSQAFLQKIAGSQITLSTVAIYPHTPNSLQILQAMAQSCGGNYYNVTDLSTLPQIFIKEASVVRKPLICEEPFTPRQKQYSPVLSGIGESELRPLKGYVCTTAKALADVPLISDKDDPVLAHWQYGVGKAVAFTSEAQARWAPDWIEWNKFAKFWAQTVRWTLRGELSQNLQLHTEIEEGIGHVVVDAMDNQGNFINFLELEGSVVDPHLAAQPLALRQTGPGRYEATFPVAGEGSYLVTARSAGKEGITGFITGGLAIPYSPEYKTVRSNEAVMRKIAEVTGGRVASLVNNQVDFFDHDLPSGSRAEPLWPGALALAILLVPVDVFFRRVIIDWRDVARVWNTARGWVAGQVRAILARRRPEREEAVEALLQVKEKVREQMTPRAPSEQFIEALHRAKQQAGASVLDAGEEKAPVPRPVVVRKSEKEDLRRPRVPAERFTSQLLEAKKRAHQEGKGHTQQ